MGIESYIASRATYVSAEKKVDDLTRLLESASSHLKNRRHLFSFSNTGVGLPAEVVMGSRAISLNGDEWPSAKAINEALAEWHEARSAVRNEWASLNQDQKAALQPPPDTAQSDHARRY